MKFKVGNYEVMVRRATKPQSKKVTYCRSYEELNDAVRAAGIDIWQDKDSFRRACTDAGIEVDTDSEVFFIQAPVKLRNMELDSEQDEAISHPLVRGLDLSGVSETFKNIGVDGVRCEKLRKAVISHLSGMVDRYRPHVRPADILEMQRLAGGGWKRADVRAVLDDVVKTAFLINGKRLHVVPHMAGEYVLLSADLEENRNDSDDAAVLKMPPRSGREIPGSEIC